MFHGYHSWSLIIGISGEPLSSCALLHAQTSHPVAVLDGCTNIPLSAAGLGRRNHSVLRHTGQENGRSVSPISSSLIRPRRKGTSRGFHCDPVGQHTLGDIFPQRHEEFSRQRGDHDLLHPTSLRTGSFMEPSCKAAIRLMPQPKPGQFDHGRAQAWVARLRDALFAIDRSTSPRSRK